MKKTTTKNVIAPFLASAPVHNAISNEVSHEASKDSQPAPEPSIRGFGFHLWKFHRYLDVRVVRVDRWHLIVCIMYKDDN